LLVGINSVVQETASDRTVPMVVKYLHVFWKSSCLFWQILGLISGWPLV